MNPWCPKSVYALRHYSLQKFVADLIAGVTVGLVALPLAMAFAISSGMPPQNGIYGAVAAGFLISLFGGTNRQIGGPTGAFVVVVSGIIQKHGVDGLFLCTLMAGGMLVLLGATGLGTTVKYIPRSVVIGFTNGIAVLIASTQIKDFFGLHATNVPSDFLERMAVLWSSAHTFSLASLLLGAAALILILLMARFVKRVPGTIVALLLGTAVVMLFKLPVETIGSKFGGIPSGLPHIGFPPVHLSKFRELLSPALTVAMLGAIESLLSAVVADRMTGDRHNPNVELIAQGIANLACPFVGGLPATGAIARTATNIRSGAKTPMAGIIHSLTLLAVLLFAAPLAKFVPMCVLSAILFIVSYNMGEWREIPHLLKLTKADIVVWVVTFALTVFADLTVAVEVGMILAALLYIQKVSRTTTVTEITADDIEAGQEHILQDKVIPDYVSVFRIHGPFLFGSTDKIQEITDRLDFLSPIVILRLRNMTAIDATGLLTLEELSETLHKTGRTLLLCGPREQPRRLIERKDFADRIGPENILPSIQFALQRAASLHDSMPV